MITLLECFISEAARLLRHELGGELELVPRIGAPQQTAMQYFQASVAGGWSGSFLIAVDQRFTEFAGFAEGAKASSPKTSSPKTLSILLTRIAAAAVQQLSLLSRLPAVSYVVEELTGEWDLLPAANFEIRVGDESYALTLCNRTQPTPEPLLHEGSANSTEPLRDVGRERTSSPTQETGYDLLLGVELDATLRFGAREMALDEVLELGPGDVVQLDRHVTDPVDLIVGDKIVARGEVVLVNGRFGLRVTEVAEPQNCLESIRCLL